MFGKRLFLLAAALMLLSGCSPVSSKDKDSAIAIAVSVNNYYITYDEFEKEFKDSAFGKTDTPESRKDFLDSLIDRKLILQYAQKEGFDKEKNFLKTIEKFWEQSLLKIAVDKKTREIESRISAAGWEAKRAEETKMLSDWMNELRKRARITAKDDVLKNAADKDGR